MGIRVLVLILMLVLGIRSVQAAPSTEGLWSSVIDWPHVAAHMSVLPNGRVMTWARPSTISNGITIWNPDSGQFQTVPSPGHNIYCGAHSFLADGKLFVTGGRENTQTGVLPDKATAYDPFDNIWYQAPNMNAGRYYPTNVTLASGNVLVLLGTVTSDGGVNKLPQVFDPATWTWRNLTSALVSSPLWYPYLFVAPNGKVFMAGPNQLTRYLTTTGTGVWTNVAQRNVGFRDYGSAVLYAKGKVLVTGGSVNNIVTNSAEVINLNNASPAWRSVSGMIQPRQVHNLTLLPDGNVLVTGGTADSNRYSTANAKLSAELWNPNTQQFSSLASMTVPRVYHSTAALLSDGRVIVAGGEGVGGAKYPTAQIYSPPYLFKGARPTIITSAPSQIGYGQVFVVITPDSTDITKVTLIRLSSVTHSVNMNQRINQLSFTKTTAGLNVNAPSDRRLAPPGHYMLFILNGNGVPSLAKIIQIQ